MNPVIIFLFCAASLFAADAWPAVDYSEVRAFAWDPRRAGYPEEVIRPDFTFVDGIINKDGTTLTGEQARRLVAAARSRRYERIGVAGCYNPHNAFVFFDSAKKPVAYLEVCFDCLGARIEPPQIGIAPDFLALANLCAELKLPFGSHKTIKEFEEGSFRIVFRLNPK